MFGAWGLISRNVTGAGNTLYAFDERGNVSQRVNSGGGVVSSDLYDAFGNATSTGGADVWGFGGQAGYYTDAETGLILCTHRFYDLQQGRFLTRDPIGYGGGINLYGYTGNNPVNRLDPEGLLPIHAISLTGGGLGPESQLEEEEAHGGAIPPALVGPGALAMGGLPTEGEAPLRVTQTDLYAFQSRTNAEEPQAPRPGRDVNIAGNGMVQPQLFGPANGVFGKGVSLTSDPLNTNLSGNYFRIPAGTQIPTGVNIMQDGSDLYPGSDRGPGHHSFYPTGAFDSIDFNNAYKNMFEEGICGSKGKK